MNGQLKGLIIDTPYIDRILSGSKTWEMRSTATKQRGPVALIRKGSGTIIGFAKIVDSKGPFTRDEMLRNQSMHQIETHRIQSGAVDKWKHAWVLADVRKLERPVPYAHPSGAVIWVNLSQDEQARVIAQVR